MANPEDKTGPRSPLAQALWEHSPDEVSNLMAKGASLGDDENAVKLVADGVTAHHFDRFNTQDANSMTLTLAAAREGGIDLNAPIDGEPPVHFVTRSYTRRWASNAYDKSEAAMYGLTATDQFTRLAAFAVGGVDFHQRDSHGRSFDATAKDELKAYASSNHPKSAEPGYVPNDPEFGTPALATVQKQLAGELQGVKHTVRTQLFERMAEAKKAETRNRPRRSQTERDCPF